MDTNTQAGAESVTNRLLDEGIELVTDAAAAEGVTISSKTGLRWCVAGVRGVRLESVKVRGRRMTSRAARDALRKARELRRSSWNVI